MPEAKPRTLSDIDPNDREARDAFWEHILAEGHKRIQADIKKLHELGCMDSEGNSLCPELPEDTRPGSEYDNGACWTATVQAAVN